MLLGAIKYKMSIEQAIKTAEREGWDFKKDYYAQSTPSMNEELLRIAKARGYRKSPSSSGSTARAFFEYLKRKK